MKKEEDKIEDKRETAATSPDFGNNLAAEENKDEDEAEANEEIEGQEEETAESPVVINDNHSLDNDLDNDEVELGMHEENTENEHEEDSGDNDSNINNEDESGEILKQNTQDMIKDIDVPNGVNNVELSISNQKKNSLEIPPTTEHILSDDENNNKEQQAEADEDIEKSLEKPLEEVETVDEDAKERQNLIELKNNEYLDSVELKSVKSENIEILDNKDEETILDEEESKLDNKIKHEENINISDDNKEIGKGKEMEVNSQSSELNFVLNVNDDVITNPETEGTVQTNTKTVQDEHDYGEDDDSEDEEVQLGTL